MHPLTDTILSSAIGSGLSRDEAAAIAAQATVRDAVDGEVLVQEGDRDSRLHVILKGKIAVARRTDQGWNILHTLGEGDLAGELTFMHDEPRYAALVASGPARVLVIARRDFEALLDTQPRAVYNVMRSIMRVAHDVQARLSRQMLDLQNYLYRPGGRY